MSKKVPPKRSNSKDYWQRAFSFSKKQLQLLVKSGRPYLTLKYWLIYVAAFGLGFYLWGPVRGITKVKNWGAAQGDKSGQTITIQALQREIELLKQMINKENNREEERVSKFDPDSFSRPAVGEIVQGFEWVKNDETWRLHSGTDIGLPLRSSVMAAAEGVVKEITSTPEGGLLMVLDHGDGWESVYGNLEEVAVKKGDRIIKGMIIGTSGAKCCNSMKEGFHFGINHNQKPVDPGDIIPGLTK